MAGFVIGFEDSETQTIIHYWNGNDRIDDLNGALFYSDRSAARTMKGRLQGTFDGEDVVLVPVNMSIVASGAGLI